MSIAPANDAKWWSMRALVCLVLCCVSVAASGTKPEPATSRTKVNPGDGLTYAWIPPGKFLSGCSPGDKECYLWEPARTTASIAKGYWIGTTEVTQRAYEQVMHANPSLYRGALKPVDRISWYAARNFCAAVGMRLPTSLEWEYAARGGSRSARYGELDAIAWYHANSGDSTHEVGQKQPNPFGLYDTLGNVWEWVLDSYPRKPQTKILRGDSFANAPESVRVSDLLWAPPETAHRDMGFRCAGD
jgi:formylglycine-generating enzyme